MLLQKATVSLKYSHTVQYKPAAFLLLNTGCLSHRNWSGARLNVVLLVHTQTVVVLSAGFSYERGNQGYLNLKIISPLVVLKEIKICTLCC